MVGDASLAPAKMNSVKDPTLDLMRRFGEDGQDPEVLRKCLDRVIPLLTVEEEISYIAVQRRLAALVPDSFVLTNKRFVHLSPNLLGQLSVRDIGWKQLVKVDLQESMFGASLTIHAEGLPLRLEGLHKVQARKAYAIAREMQDRAHEYRRQMDLEARRATAGSVNVTAVPQPVVAFEAKASMPDLASELRKLKALMDEGLITADEYAGKKSELLARM